MKDTIAKCIRDAAMLGALVGWLLGLGLGLYIGVTITERNQVKIPSSIAF